MILKGTNKAKHPLRWFVNRVGKELIKNNTADLFNLPVKVMSEQHAKALFITQKEKNYTYNEI